jgi:dethiobiotin synthetase
MNGARVPASSGLFVAGTDTGVGKTLVSEALLWGFAAAGLRVVGMKPVAAGARKAGGQWRCGDVECLVRASNVMADRRDVNPYCFAPPVAPHIAAAQAGTRMRLDAIRRSYYRLSAQADMVVVEGAGGWLVPLNGRQTLADIPSSLGLPVVLVVGLRLGCLNHALLTAAMIEATGLTLAGWIANRLQPRIPFPAENIDTLRRRIAAPLLGVIPFQGTPDAGRASRRLDISTLYSAIKPIAD